MMILTAKVDIKRLMLILAAAAAVILLTILLLGGRTTETAAQAPAATPTNDARVSFLKEFGWDVVNSPKESSQVRIPNASGEVFDRYNALQKSQGYDLTEYAGKKVMRYVYEIRNYPGATGQVYATVLVYKNRIIGGDVTDTSPKGQIRGFKMPAVPEPEPAVTQNTPEDKQLPEVSQGSTVLSPEAENTQVLQDTSF